MNVEIDVKNKVYILEKVKISFDDVNIKAVLFNDVSIFNQLILDSKQTVVKQTAKPKKVPKAKETIIENVDETEYENKE